MTQWVMQADVLQQDGRLEEALDHLLVAKALEPEDLDVGKRLFHAYLEKGHLFKGLDELKRLHKLYPMDEQLCLELSRLLRETKSNDEAIEFYKRLLTRNPVHPEALEELGALYLKQEQPEKAIEVLDKLKLLSPKNVNVLLQLSMANLQIRQVSKARESLKQAYRLDPTRSEVRLQLARLYLGEELYEQAIQLLTPLEDEEGVSLEKFVLLVDCYTGNCQYDKASDLLTQYQEVFDKEADFARCHIKLNQKLNLTQEVDEWYSVLNEWEPNWKNIDQYCGFLEQKKLFSKMESMLIEKSREPQYSSNPKLFYRLACLYKADSPEDALNWLQKSLDIDLAEEPAVLKGELLVKLNQYSRAVQWFEILQDKFPDADYQQHVDELIERDKRYKATYTLMKKARTALSSRQYKRALKCYKDMVERVPDNVQWLEQLGNLFSFDVNYPEALVSFEKALHYEKNNKEPLLQKILYLSMLYNDFDKSHDAASKLADYAGPDDFELLQKRLIIARHLLAEKSKPVEYLSPEIA
jgi:tetratricopeptide (TPR) repeat protein